MSSSTTTNDSQNVPPPPSPPVLAAVPAASDNNSNDSGPQEAVAWSISFAPSRGGKRRGPSKKEKDLIANHNSTVAPAAKDTDGSATSASDADIGGDDANTNKKKALDVVELNEAQLVDESILVPRNLITTKEDIAARKYFSQERWFCLSRPQYKRSCGVSSLTSVWNALYSVVGYGTLPPISCEEVMTIIGFKPPFEQIRWGPIAGNIALCVWFNRINKAKGTTGKSFIFWKPVGKNRTIGLTDEQAEQMTKDALRNPKMALVYHCKNHYFVPIGYDEQPAAPRLAMLPKLARSEYDTQLLIGEPSRGGNPGIHCRPFSMVAQDLHTEMPQSFNIRHPERGVETTLQLSSPPLASPPPRPA